MNKKNQKLMLIMAIVAVVAAVVLMVVVVVAMKGGAKEGTAWRNCSRHRIRKERM